MSKNLVIVESPAKAKTIEKYLGSDYKVASSFGHIRDLVKKKGADSMAIDIENNFAPSYSVSSEKKDVVSNLKKLVKSSETVWLASDEDREGEAIAWHLTEALGLDASQTKRIVFNEITKKAIVNAIEHPRTIDMDLVNAQQARRVMDRIVGFELSPVLWRKIKGKLSAGRVQSVAVRLIVERERDINAFVPASDFRVLGQFTNAEGFAFEGEWSGTAKTAQDVAAALQPSQAPFQVSSLVKKTGTRRPTAPFTTSTLQQEASRKLGFSVNRTMSVAQKLYENGLITYMRTDSVNLSQDARQMAAAAILDQYGDQYLQSRTYSTKSQGAQEAHEAIRPTQFDRPHAGADDSERKLYHLIWQRTIASQMAEAKIDRTTAHLTQGNLDFVAKGEMIAFDGFMKVYLEGVDEKKAEVGMLPSLTEGGQVQLEGLQAIQRFTRPQGRFTEATLVKALEEKGIGRPSTYAPTITTIQKREYIKKGTRDGVERTVELGHFQNGTWDWSEKKEKWGSDKGRLVPTDMGNLVTDFLMGHFDMVMDYAFTAKMEENFDMIADGKVSWTEVMSSFYDRFHPMIEKAGDADRESGERNLGTHPESGKTVLVRMARFGPVIQVDNGEGKKPDYYNIPEDYSMGTITLEQALELMALPRLLGQHNGADIKANIGRYGPYVQMNRTFESIPEDKSPYTITLEEAVDLLQAKAARAAAAELAILDGDRGEIKILDGRYGPYIKFGRKNVTLPKDVEPKAVTYEQACELIDEAAKKPKKGRGKRKS